MKRHHFVGRSALQLSMIIIMLVLAAELFLAARAPEPTLPPPMGNTPPALVLKTGRLTLSQLLDAVYVKGEDRRTEFQKEADLKDLQGLTVVGRAFVDQVFKRGGLLLRPFEEERHLKDYAYAEHEMSPETLLSLNQGTPVEIECTFIEYDLGSIWLKCSRVEVIR